MSLDNIEEVRRMIADQIQKTIDGEQTPSVLDSLSNAAGKMVATTKVQIEYAKLRGKSPDIEFLNGSWLKD